MLEMWTSVQICTPMVKPVDRNNVDVDQCASFNAACNGNMIRVHRLPEKWLPVSIAPSDTALEVGVMDKHDVVALVFPVRKSGTYWVDAATNTRIDILPTHWRTWAVDRS